MQPKVIKSDAEHAAAPARLDELMAADPAPGTRESEELELLSLLVERYDDERFPLGLPDPIDAIRVRMQEEGLRPRDLAPYLGGANKVSEVLARKRPLTLKMIRALHEGLSIAAEIPLREPHGRLPDRGNVEVGRFPWQAMAKRGWLQYLGVASEAIRDAEEELYDRFSESMLRRSFGPPFTVTRLMYEPASRWIPTPYSRGRFEARAGPRPSH